MVQVRDTIQIKGAREHNLAVDELSIPKQQLIVFTGPSGSGKSSLAFDTLYAEGQRRYVESLSSYARQFLGQLDKPAFDHIKGLCPTIAIEQKAASANPRSTVGTITEIHDYLRVLYARLGELFCPQCGDAVQALSTDEIIERVAAISGPCLLLAPLVENRKGELKDVLQALLGKGFIRVRVNGEVRPLDENLKFDKKRKHTLELVVDRFEPGRVSRQRLADSVETALREGQQRLSVQPVSGRAAVHLGRERACARCSIAVPDPTPQHFSFNSPLGMCSDCNGLGQRMDIDSDLLIPDQSLSIRQGAIIPYANVMARGSGINFGIFEALKREFGVDLDRPWSQLSKKHRDLILYGTGDRRVQVSWVGSHGEVSWPQQYEGVIPAMVRRYRETKSEEMRRYYTQFMSETACTSCHGARLGTMGQTARVAGHSLTEVSSWSVAATRAHFASLRLSGSQGKIAKEIITEINGRLDFLSAVGLDYLTLNRAATSLSGGEEQRIRLAAQLGSELSGVLYVLDEPSIGLHARDTRRLTETLRRLRDLGNTVLVVEHERGTIESADHVVDFGPGAGRQGGHVVFQGTPKQLRAAPCLTGQYLSGKRHVIRPESRREPKTYLTIKGATENNLKNIDVPIPLGLLVAVTGVSGAGKSTLVSDILYPALSRQLHGAKIRVGAHRGIEGLSAVDKIIWVDQSPIGRTPRSNPATYTKAFDDIRNLFAQTGEARALGFAPGRFSFNVTGGRCEACQGDGLRKIEMHFLADVYITCEVCHGRRYNEATLAVRYRNKTIADVLETSVDDAYELFQAHPGLAATLKTLRDVGLGYVHLGQPAPTLSGGEAQRVKLSRELSRRDTGRTLYVLDEPTTGLHFDDVNKLLGVLMRLADAGNTVVVIEHDLDVIRAADWVIDLGPEGGSGGGELVAAGTPEQLVACQRSFTGRALLSAGLVAQKRPPKAKSRR
jgi:excinuclease ABC subunit A